MHYFINFAILLVKYEQADVILLIKPMSDIQLMKFLCLLFRPLQKSSLTATLTS